MASEPHGPDRPRRLRCVGRLSGRLGLRRRSGPPCVARRATTLAFPGRRGIDADTAGGPSGAARSPAVSALPPGVARRPPSARERIGPSAGAVTTARGTVAARAVGSGRRTRGPGRVACGRRTGPVPAPATATVAEGEPRAGVFLVRGARSGCHAPAPWRPTTPRSADERLCEAMPGRGLQLVTTAIPSAANACGGPVRSTRFGLDTSALADTGPLHDGQTCRRGCTVGRVTPPRLHGGAREHCLRGHDPGQRPACHAPTAPRRSVPRRRAVAARRKRSRACLRRARLGSALRSSARSGATGLESPSARGPGSPSDGVCGAFCLAGPGRPSTGLRRFPDQDEFAARSVSPRGFPPPPECGRVGASGHRRAHRRRRSGGQGGPGAPGDRDRD